MANWQMTLKLWPEYHECDSENPDQIRSLASLIAKRLHDLPALKPRSVPNAMIEERKHELVREFMQVAKSQHSTKDDLNRVMVWLYQWADQQLPTVTGRTVSVINPKVCWVSTQEGM